MKEDLRQLMYIDRVVTAEIKHGGTEPMDPLFQVIGQVMRGYIDGIYKWVDTVEDGVAVPYQKLTAFVFDIFHVIEEGHQKILSESWGAEQYNEHTKNEVSKAAKKLFTTIN